MYCGTSVAFEFTEQIPKTGLTYVKFSEARVSCDGYTMLYHLDVTEYLELTKTVGKFISDAGEQCKHIRGSVCDIMLVHITTQLWNMKRDDIEAYQQRYGLKRSINIVGSVLHWAFGHSQTLL